MIAPLVAVSAMAQQQAVSVEPRLDSSVRNSHYVGQRAPLAPSPLQKLPPGAVTAGGWLKVELDLQKQGFSGRLPEISRYLDPKDNAWMGTGNSDRAGWEELPYWLRGQVSLAYVTGDPKLIAEVKTWVEAVLASQKPDGWFGPEANRTTKLGTPDLWPNMLMQAVLQTYFEATGDKRATALMSRYCDYLASLPDGQLVDPRHYWHYHRVGDQIASLVWLYDHTGERKILDLAARLHKASSDWVGGIPNRHGVNFAQGFREPATYSLFSRKSSDWDATERDLKEFRDVFGQAPGGLYAADENARDGKTDPRQAVESCTVAEMMFSHELLLQYSGDPAWADRAEDVAFNWMPVTMTPDLKALRYLQAPNLAVSDAASKSPGVENGGPMFLMDPNDHRCCQHNIGMGWPYLTEHLWFATSGNGLAALIYAPSKVKARVADGTEVTIEEMTDYPFRESVTFTVEPERTVRFPLSLRIPGWCEEGSVKVNGSLKAGHLKGSQFVTLDREWKSGTKVELTLPMKVRRQTWPGRPGTVSVYRGPLAYSLAIQEEYRKVPRPNGWDAFEIWPVSKWNFGLTEVGNFTLHWRPIPHDKQVFEPDNVPMTLETTAQEIPEWTLDMYGLVSPLQACPALSTEPVQKVTLIPMGSARLRVTVFPTVSPTGHRWTPTPQAKPGIPTTFSYRNWWDSERALSDGLLPKSANDQEIPRFTWWDHKGTREWVQYTFPETRTFQRSRVYWFDDSPEGGCRVPATWKVQVKVSGEWTDVESTRGPVADGGWSIVEFKPVGGTEVRLVVQLQPGYSAGILEWEVD